MCASTFVRLRPDALGARSVERFARRVEQATGSTSTLRRTLPPAFVAAALNPPAPAKRSLPPIGKASTQLLRQNTDNRSA
jgi:hypothetical protein